MKHYIVVGGDVRGEAVGGRGTYKHSVKLLSTDISQSTAQGKIWKATKPKGNEPGLPSLGRRMQLKTEIYASVLCVDT